MCQLLPDPGSAKPSVSGASSQGRQQEPSYKVVQLELTLCCQDKLDSGWDVKLALLR